MKKYFGILFLAINCWAGEGIRLENVTYPYPVKIFKFTSQQQALEMAYMDVMPDNPPKATVVLLHGKNFSGGYWGQTAEYLLKLDYRIIIPDQIGFGKSSKPAHYQFTFQQLATNTHALLASCGIQKAIITGHSMGGMVATRYALMFPESTPALALVDPIGLEDWKAKGVPWISLDAAYQAELKQTAGTLRAYEKESYYHGEWKPEYERWVSLMTNFFVSPDYPRMAWNQALTTDMIFTQPVCYEFSQLKMPVLLIVGQSDRSAMGKDRVPEAQRKLLGDYSKLGRETANLIPNAKLIELPGIGHLPQVEAFEKFIDPFAAFLQEQPSATVK